MELDKKVKAGVRLSQVKRFLEHSKFSETDLMRTAGIPASTWARRKKEGKLNAAESERVTRLARLFSHAEAVLNGARNAKNWMEREQAALEWRRPVDLAETTFGAEEVEDLLSRIEYGVF